MDAESGKWKETILKQVSVKQEVLSMDKENHKVTNKTNSNIPLWTWSEKRNKAKHRTTVLGVPSMGYKNKKVTQLMVAIVPSMAPSGKDKTNWSTEPGIPSIER